VDSVSSPPLARSRRGGSNAAHRGTTEYLRSDPYAITESAGRHEGLVVGHLMHAYLAPTETFVHNQIRFLRRYRPVVVAHHRRPATDFTFEEGVIADEALSEPLARLQRLAYRTARIALPPGLAVASRYLHAREARLLHYHYLNDARFLLSVKRRTGLPAIVSAYGYDVSSFPRMYAGMGRHYLRPIFGRLDAFLAMSEDMADDIVALGCSAEKVIVHYHGIDTRRFSFPQRAYGQDAPVTLLCCGRLVESKGHHHVLRALRRVQRRGRIDFRVVIVGDGPLETELRRLVHEYGWQDRVTMTGHIPHGSPALIEQFRGADLFAQPSFTLDGLKEGIPGTIVEAMACGLGVVATHHAGIPSVIHHGREGLLVPENDIAALADALEALIVDPTLRESLGRKAAERAQRELDVRVRTPDLERTYDEFV
jgi:colanic acid/amylovoran biosynthesis glycosyltransferase